MSEQPGPGGWPVPHGSTRAPSASDQPAPTYAGVESPVASPPAEAEADGWRRLDRRMLLIHPVREFIRFLPAFLGIAIAGTTSGDGEPWWFGLVAIVGAVLLGVLRWFTTRFRFTPEQVQLRTGLISRKTVTSPTDRVRTVDVTASPMHRLLGLAEVKIGTGADSSDLTLDGLSAQHATALREELIHRRRAATAARGVPDVVGESPSQATLSDEPDQEIVRLEPGWIRYALLTSTGLISAAAILGVGWQILERAGFEEVGGSAEQRAEDIAAQIGVFGLVASAVVAGVVVVLLLSVLGYVLTYWNFRLTRSTRGGTLHVSRGLFTTRATTIEEARLRGVTMKETLPMRPARGGTLDAITTGLASDSESGGTLVPPAPVAVARRVADDVLETPGVLDHPLQPHGPAATRRRWTRALSSGLLIAAGAFALTFWWAPWLGLVGLVPLLATPWLAHDRARSLGHALTERFLVTRNGSVSRDTEVVERRGVIGVTVRESFFQRRAGLATLVVATAAGDEVYYVYDVAEPRAVELAAELLPGHLVPLVEPQAGRVGP